MAGNYPFKILMTADTLGGVWTYSLELIRALQPYHVEVALATMGAPLNDKQRADIAKLGNVELYESNYKLEWMDQPWKDVEQAGEWLRWLCRKIDPDLIHLNNYVHGACDWRGKPVLVVAHSCVLSWWKAVLGTEAPNDWHQYKDKVKAGLHAADMVVAPSWAMMNEAEQIYGPFRNKQVIYNGLDPFDFNSGEKEPIIFSMGRVWDEAKNLKILTEVASQMPWPIYIAGQNIHASNGKFTHLDNVNFLGVLSRTEVVDWLSRSSIYVMPAKYEPFGLSALEAAMSGCTLVLSDIPSLKEIWTDSAIFVPCDQKTRLMKALLDLTDNTFYRRVLTSKAYSRSLGFTSQKMAREYFNTYLQLLMKENDFYYKPGKVAHF